jgi:hypothetical protein
MAVLPRLGDGITDIVDAPNLADVHQSLSAWDTAGKVRFGSKADNRLMAALVQKRPKAHRPLTAIFCHQLRRGILSLLS